MHRANSIASWSRAEILLPGAPIGEVSTVTSPGVMQFEGKGQTQCHSSLRSPCTDVTDDGYLESCYYHLQDVKAASLHILKTLLLWSPMTTHAL